MNALVPVLFESPGRWPAAVVVAACLLSFQESRAEEVKAGAKRHEVKAIRDLAYHEGAGADPIKHKLDLYLPEGVKDYPVLFFVHGGAWRTGDKNQFGVYSNLGMLFARHGIGTVVTNYRLSPAVAHPEHIKDVARAYSWTFKNIAKHGGRADQIFACGHSAGGHLVSLLATDDAYLKAEGLTRQAIRGVVPMSGVYTLPDLLYPSVFGKDPQTRKNAFPLNHVKAGLPPFLIIYADSDFPTCGKVSGEFCKALQEKNCAAELLEIKNRNHITIIMCAGIEDDPVPEAVLRFIAAQTRKADASP